MVAEIGINHNGSLETALEMISAARQAGCDAVKFQKRSVDVVYSPQELALPRENPFGTTNGDLKRGLEFSCEAYREIDSHCKKLGLDWFASPWDEASVDFLEEFNVPCHKVAAACITDKGLLQRLKNTGKPVFMSTGMSSWEEVAQAVDWLGKERLVLMHCVSLYPAPPESVNLLAMRTLMERFNVPVGYSGHELDTVLSACAVSMGACAVERHFTLSRKMWGSDQKASIEPLEMAQLVSNIRDVEKALGTPEVRCLQEEIPVREKLRRVVSSSGMLK